MNTNDSTPPSPPKDTQRRLLGALGSWALTYAGVLLPAFYVLGTNSFISFGHWGLLLRLVLLGLAIVHFTKYYDRGYYRKDVIRLKSVVPKSKLYRYSYIGLLGLVFIIVGCVMYSGLKTLFADSSYWTLAFVGGFCVALIAVQIWVIYHISYVKRDVRYILAYLLLDITIFLFNYYHFYHNISQTQRLDSAIRQSQELVASLSRPINSHIAPMRDSIKSLDLRIADEERGLHNLDSINQDLNKRWEASDRLQRNRIRARIRSNDSEYEEKKKRLKSLKDSYLDVRAGYESVQRIDALCADIYTSVQRYQHASDYEVRERIRDSVVMVVHEIVGTLYNNEGLLHMLSQLRQSNEGLDSLPSRKQVRTWLDRQMRQISIRDVQRVQGLEYLMAFIWGEQPKGLSVDLWEVEKSYILLSISISALLDLLPLIIGLLYRPKEY